MVDVSCIPPCLRADEKLCVALGSTRRRRGGFGTELINITQVHLEESEKIEFRDIFCVVFLAIGAGSICCN